MAKPRICEVKEIFELGYILGVYFGDGSIVVVPKKKSYFQLNTIDKEFAEYVQKCFSLFVGPVTAEIGESQDARKGRRLLYRITICATAFCDYIRHLCGNKETIPSMVFTNRDVKLGFIAGFFDSEGWVSESKKICDNQKSKYYGNKMYRVGFGCTNKDVTETVGKFMRDFGVDINTLDSALIPSGKTFYRYFPNIDSFVNASIPISIVRKKNRLENYRRFYMSSPETTNQQPCQG